MIREDREHELRQLRQKHPQRLIAMYRSAIGIDELAELPRGVDYLSMIEKVLEAEEAAAKAIGEPPATAGKQTSNGLPARPIQ